MKRNMLALLVCVSAPLLLCGCSIQSNPKKTAKAFCEYIIDDNIEEALLLVAPDERSDYMQGYKEGGRPKKYSMKIDIDGDTAFVKIFTDQEPLPFGFHMKRIDGKWWICTN
jgi:hypothetical protein